ncbi:MAG: TIR domain-containing protein [Cyanobacteria bacterium J06648_16]
MHPAIQKINWVYFREGVDDFERSFMDLLAIFERHRHYVQQHTHFLIRAIRWEQKHHQPRRLLIADQLQQAEHWLKTRFEQTQPPCVPTDLHCTFITESLKNSRNLMTQVFLAHAESDIEALHQIRGSLQREGIVVWSSETDVRTGDDFSGAVERGIEQADNVVYLLSPAAVRSQICQHELDYALSLHKRLIPVLVQPVAPADVPLALRDLQYVDLTDNVKAEDYQLDESQLLQILQQDAAYYERHKVLLAQALKWERQNHNPSILLRGYNLSHAATWLETAKTRNVHAPTSLHHHFLTESLRRPAVDSLDVFVSYSRVDADLARSINNRLQLQGYLTWFDQESIAAGTADFEQEIYSGIRASDTFLFILSPQSISSPYCDREVEYAASLNKRIVTILYRSVDETKLNSTLAKIQYLDFRGDKGDFETRFGELVRTLDTDRNYLRSHTKWLQRALEWEKAAKNTDLLLSGSPCAVAEDWLALAEVHQKQPPPTPLQKTFIRESQSALETARHRERRQLWHLRSLLGLSIVGLIGAAALAGIAGKQYQRANATLIGQVEALSESSLILSDSHRAFEGLLTVLRIGRERSMVRRFDKDLEQLIGQAFWHALSTPMEKVQLEEHTDKIRDISFSPDGQRLATASNDGTVRLWTARGKLLKTLTIGSRAFGVHFSPDSQTLVTRSRDKILGIWDREGNLIEAIENQVVDLGVAFSADSQFFVAKSTADEARLWTKTGELVASLPHAELDIIQLSQQSSIVLTRSKDGFIKLWSLDGTPSKTFDYPDFDHTLLSRDGQWLVLFGDSNRPSLLVMVNVDTAERRVFEHEWPINRVTFSDNPAYLATYQRSGNSPVTLWNIENRQKQQIRVEDTVNDVSFGGLSQLLAVAESSGAVKLWNFSGEQLHSLLHNAPVEIVGFSPDEETIVTLSNDHDIKLWHFLDPNVLQLGTHQDWATRMQFSPDGKRIVTTSHDRTARIWERNGRFVRALRGHTQAIQAVAYSLDSRMIATGGKDKTVRIWSDDGELIQTLPRHDDAIRNLAFSPDQSKLLTRTNTGMLYGWDLSGTLRFRKEGEYRPTFMQGTGTFITTSGPNINVWREDGTFVQRIEAHKEVLTGLTVSQDGQLIGSSSMDGVAKLWSVTGEHRATLPHDNVVRDVAISPDGAHVVTVSEDTTVKLWKTSGELVETLQGHDRLVFAVDFSSDGRFFATAGNDQRVIIWDLEGNELQSQRFPAEIYRIAFSPDNRQLAATGEHNSVLVWNLALDKLPRSSLNWDTYVAWAMKQGCDRMRTYLENKPEGDRDRTLCEGID